MSYPNRPPLDPGTDIATYERTVDARAPLAPLAGDTLPLHPPYASVDSYVTELSERCPDISLKIDLRSGAWTIPDRSGLEESVANQVKAGWMTAAEGLGIDPTAFPVDKVHVWAPPKPGPLPGIRSLLQNTIHMSRPTARMFYASRQITPPTGQFTHGIFAQRLDLPVSKQGRVSVSTVAHELIHAYLRTRKADIDPGVTGEGSGKFTNEGLGEIGNQLYHERLTGTPQWADRDNFSKLAEGLRQSPSRELLVDYAYNPANTWLHRYLIVEKGGLEPIMEMSQGFPGTPSSKQLLAAYQETYGQPLPDLIEEAGEWYGHNFGKAATAQHEKYLHGVYTRSIGQKS